MLLSEKSTMMAFSNSDARDMTRIDEEDDFSNDDLVHLSRHGMQHGDPSLTPGPIRRKSTRDPGLSTLLEPSSSAGHNHRRYVVGERALIHPRPTEPRLRRLAHPVNKYGFPYGEGKTPEEQKGPHLYVLATVKRVHFGENLQYYTVQRADTGKDERADVGENSEY